ncbi:MAG: hypothetical protein LLF83_02330 [Methanobacterium sp.]|nr:hypothetical protein [Methanobacterium sp.]
MTNINEKARSALAGAKDKIKVDPSSMGDVSEKVSVISEKFKGTVKEVVPEKSDELSDRIDQYLEERKDQIINDWELATKNDAMNLEKRYLKLSKDMGKLDDGFNEYRETSNKRIKEIEDRLEKLENPEN